MSLKPPPAPSASTGAPTSTDVLRQKIDRLGERRRKLQARLSKKTRASDTRRKILLGAMVLQELEASPDPETQKWLKGWIDGNLSRFLVRPGDHELFPDLLGGSAIGEAMPGTADVEPSETKPVKKGPRKRLKPPPSIQR